MPASSLDFEQYWSLFVRAHESPPLRRAVVLGATFGIGTAALGLVTRRATLLLAAPLLTVLPGWVAGRSTVASIALPEAPLYRLRATLRFWARSVAGTLDDELSEPDAEPGPTRHPSDASHPAPNMVTDHTLH